jgi:hypothetical protein
VVSNGLKPAMTRQLATGHKLTILYKGQNPTENGPTIGNSYTKLTMNSPETIANFATQQRAFFTGSTPDNDFQLLEVPTGTR